MGQRGRPRHPEVLTPREQEVLALVREGLTNEQIAERLGVSFETAKAHVGSILSKLGVTTREQAAVWQPRREPLAWLLMGAAAAALASAALAFVLILGFGWLKAGDGDAAVVNVTPTVVVSPTQAAHTDAPSPTATPESLFGTKKVVDTDNLYIADKDGKNERLLAPGFGPAWSPDGDSIAFVGHWTGAGLGGENWVDLIAPAGGELREVGSYSWDDIGGPCSSIAGAVAWTSDGERLIIRTDGPTDGEIVTVATGESEQWNACDADVGPDGELYYTGACDGSGPRTSCVRVRKGSTDSQLTPGVLGAISPDRNLLAIVVSPNVALFELSTGQSHDLGSSTSVDPGTISWSPDGKRLVMAGGKIIDVESGEGRSLGSEVYSAKWSPDGTRIAYYGQQLDSSCYGILIADSVTFAPIAFIQSGEFLFDWSPDGTSIAYSRDVRAPTPGDCTIGVG